MRRLVTLMMLALCSTLACCKTVQPDGPLKAVVDGEVFTGTTVEPERHENDMLMKPEDPGGPVRWKLRF
jgi:hypothetical protein